jgi:aspartyl-tRNA(Asn)/glutamyl-tRNA(Gln) amidotransferase subunit B
MTLEPVIGLEVHAQLRTRSKVFCGCSSAYGGEPNTRVCPVCLGLPGALPVLNRRAVLFTLSLGLATGCRIRGRSLFARKNYFYPDCPKNYQISQYDLPLCEGGALAFRVEGGVKRVGITRIHLEEDAGKLVHGAADGGSLVDFNRSGVPLVEIVSEPDLASPREARLYLERLRQLLVYLEVCDGNMEEGSLRCDANVSLRPAGSDTLGVKTEVKNMNSFRGVEQALDFEIGRQRSVIEAGGTVVQETLLWDAQRGEARVMRSKEEAHDYRYFPEPDLRPLEIADAWLEEARSAVPELPDEKEKRFVEVYGIPEYDAGVLTAERGVADYYERVAGSSPDPKKAANWVMGEVLRELKERRLPVAEFPVAPEDLGALVGMVGKRTISGTLAKEVFAEMVASGRKAAEIVEQRGLGMISDEGELEGLARRVIEGHPSEVEKYRAGKNQLLGFFVGQVMKATRGKADPRAVNQILRRLLSR